MVSVLTALLLMGLCWAQGYYFADATVYDPDSKTLKSGMHLLIGTDGRTVALGLDDIPVPEGTTRIEDALVLPHYADFYVLLQERGLGLDEDLDSANQRRIGENFRLLGIDQMRDPVFPPNGVTPLLNRFQVHAQRGYLEVPGGPGAAFCLVMDPESPIQTQLERLPSTGPITLWWTQRGKSAELKWSRHRPWLFELIAALRQRNQAVGAFIEGARRENLLALKGLPLDFVEGLPDELDAMIAANLPNMTWLPLVALNDKRYCAIDLDLRLANLSNLKLYDEATLHRARGMSRQVQAAMLDRCKTWRKRKPSVLDAVQRWLANGGDLAVGSAGGHPFSFSGEIKSEIEIWSEMGVTHEQILTALFERTPQLLGTVKPFLRIGKPAHFIVYRNQRGMANLGSRVSMNFFNGILWEDSLLAD